MDGKCFEWIIDREEILLKTVDSQQVQWFRVVLGAADRSESHLLQLKQSLTNGQVNPQINSVTVDKKQLELVPFPSQQRDQKSDTKQIGQQTKSTVKLEQLLYNRPKKEKASHTTKKATRKSKQKNQKQTRSQDEKKAKCPNKIKKRTKSKAKSEKDQIKKQEDVKYEDDQLIQKKRGRPRTILSATAEQGKRSKKKVKSPTRGKDRGRRSKREEDRKDSSQKVKFEEQENKIEQKSASQQSKGQQDDSQQSKKRFSRQQKLKQRQQDKKKVEKLMRLSNEREMREEAENLVRMQRVTMAKFGTKLNINIDPNCKHYEQYKFRNREIEKKGKLYCQIYNLDPVPGQGKHCFQFKITRLSFRSVTVGVITPQNFSFQYSRDKQNCICFDAYTHSVYVEGEKTELQIEIKVSDVVRTVVEVESRSIQWYVNNDVICESIIPEHMACQKLYPYIQISNKWIKLRINDVDD